MAAEDVVATEAEEVFAIDLPPILARFGKRFEFLDTGVQVTSRDRIVGGKKTELIPWDAFKKCSVETTCCSARLRLTKADGTTFSLKFRAGNLHSSAQAIYRKMNMGVQQAVDPELQSKIPAKNKCTVLGTGLVLGVKYPCYERSTFVPWESIVTMQLSKGCCCSTIYLNTLVEEAEAGEDFEDTGVEEEELPDTMDPVVEAPPVDGNSHLVVNISGSTANMEYVFDAFMTLMNDGTKPEPLEEAPEIRKTTMYNAGILTYSGMFGTLKQYMQWTSVAAAEMEAPCIGAASLLLTDSIGGLTYIYKPGTDGFDLARKQMQNSRGGVNSQQQMKPIQRGKVRLTSEGVSITERKCLTKSTKFYPWLQIDCVLVDINCCGGTLMAVTEDGVKIQLWRAYLPGIGQWKMKEIANRIRDMKYGDPHESATPPRSFAAREGHKRACVLTDKSLVMVMSGWLCYSRSMVIDLDAIESVSLAPPRCCACCQRGVLNISVKKEMQVDGQEDKEGIQPFMVTLMHSEDAQEISEDIMNRVHARQTQE